MANWCSNTVQFIGDESQLAELAKLFKMMAEKEKETNERQLPPFREFQGGWLFDIRWEDGVLNYETKWAQNPDVIKAIADQYRVGFSYSYSEPGNCVYGEVNYRNGEYSEAALDWSDTDHYSFNEETDLYEFEGQDYESSEEICEILLERKKNALASIAAAKNNENPKS